MSRAVCQSGAISLCSKRHPKQFARNPRVHSGWRGLDGNVKSLDRLSDLICPEPELSAGEGERIRHSRLGALRLQFLCFREVLESRRKVTDGSKFYGKA